MAYIKIIKKGDLESTGRALAEINLSKLINDANASLIIETLEDTFTDIYSYPIDVVMYLHDQVPNKLPSSIFLTGKIVNSQCRVWLNDKELSPFLSLQIRNHSPSGFAWGGMGSREAQLSLAICLELFSLKKALEVYGKFKENFIYRLPPGHDFKVEIDTKYLATIFTNKKAPAEAWKFVD